MPQQRPRMPQDSPAHDEMDPNRQVIDEFRANGANPAWYHNLLARPAVTVEVGTAVLEAVSRVAAGAERDGLFDRYASEQPQLLSYQAMANREVPMIVLTPSSPVVPEAGQ
jgi:deazaflavin-dependent oxidoreductase (nitroreductase family)